MPESQDQNAKNKKLAIMGLIYKKVNDLLGAGDQLFSMQFPAQPLNYRQYQYDTNERTSVLTRPYTIAEAEFRLSDQLFNVYPITQGSNGEKLSVVYNTLLNNYVPSLKPFAAYFQDRAELSKFLLKEIDNGNGTKKSRIELCQDFYEFYLQEKLAWEKNKETIFDEIKDLSEEENSGVTLDDYAKWLGSEGMVREEELNSLYNDTVVKGYLHEVLTILGYLNVSSIAEELELAKQRMRHSVRLSLDESMLVYPVQFQPSNWFEGLAPNLSPVDLTMAHEAIRDQLRAKRRELSRAESELRLLEMISVSEDDIKKLEEDVAKGKKALNDAEGKLVEKYGQAVITATKIFLSTQCPEGSLIKLADKDVTDITKEVSQEKLDDLGLSDSSWTKEDTDKFLGDLQQAVTELHEIYKGQKEFLQKAEELTFLKAQLAHAKSHDLRFEKINLNQRIHELHTDIEDLGELVAGVYRENQKPKGSVTLEQDKNDRKKWNIHLPGSPTGGTFKLTIKDKTTDSISYNADGDTLKSTLEKLLGSSVTVTATKTAEGSWEVTFSEDVGEIIADGANLTVTHSTFELPLIPTGSKVTEADGMFMDVLIKSREIEESSSKVETESVTQFGWNLRALLYSAGGQHDISQATTDTEKTFFSQDIDIGFRVAKVTFDRGGWFNPQIFKMSHAFYRLADLKAAPDLTKDKVLTAVKQDNPTDAVVKLLKDEQGKSYILPAYPVSMIIAKDITIKVKQDASQSKATRTVLENSNTAGGGFLGFSCSYSSANLSTTDKTFYGQQGDYFYIRIPGPQILGYYLQFVPQDNAQPYEAIFQEIGDSEIEKALKAYDLPQLQPATPTNPNQPQPQENPI